MNKNDMYSHLINGGDPQVLLDAFMKELNATQKEVDQKKEAERLEAQKKKEVAEAAAKKEETLNHYREAAVAAFTSYLALVLGEEISEDIVRASIVELEESINTIKKIRVSINGEELKSIFDLFL
jgi:hypothetical protein